MSPCPPSFPSSSHCLLSLLTVFLFSHICPFCLLHGNFSLTSVFPSSCLLFRLSLSPSPPLLSRLPLLLRLSKGSASGLSEQPLYRAMRGEQRGGDGSLPQHQEGGLSWDLQLAGVRAPSGGWGDLLQHYKNIMYPFFYQISTFLRFQVNPGCTHVLVFTRISFITITANNVLTGLSVLCVFSVWERLEVLPNKQRQEDAHRLHQERSALRHREVSGTSSLRRASVIIKSLTAGRRSYSVTVEQRGGAGNNLGQ